MQTLNRNLFELIQVAIGNRRELTRTLTPDEWANLRLEFKKQGMLGIGYVGITKLLKEQVPPIEILAQWVHDAEKIREKNAKATAICKKLVEGFDLDGFETCILKGQSNHSYYQKELAEYRTCGDIDVWVCPKGNNRHPISTVIEYLKKQNLIESICYLHAEVKPINRMPVEVHFRPSFMNCPWSNSRFLKIFDYADCVRNTHVTTDMMLPKLRTDYDVIFQLNHLYRHLIDEGVGLRQVLDYYYVLIAYHDKIRNLPNANRPTMTMWEEGVPNSFMSKEQIACQINRCDMKRFASALMWVLQEVLGMSADWMICNPLEKDGRFLLDEIMLAGNFGHYDPRMQELDVQKGKTSYQVKRALRRMQRNFRFITSYPLEVIFEPYARLTHFWWRKFKLWRY